MNSVRDLPKEGLPHSDIRGSTIARISPRLFAACHVLHRLLAPRHPPNALVSLAIPTQPPARSTKPRNKQPSQAASLTLSYSHFHSQIHLSKITRQGRVQRTGHHLRRFWKRAPRMAQGPGGTSIRLKNACHGRAVARHRKAMTIGSRQSLMDSSRGNAAGKMEANGFEPMTPCLQSRCSTS